MPPTPLMKGSTTPMANAVAIAASMALPPRARMSAPTCAASGCMEVTMPARLTASLLSINQRLRVPTVSSSPVERSARRLLDDLHLRSVRALAEAHPASARARQLLEDRHAVGAQLGHRAGIVVRVHGHVLEAVVLLPRLRVDQRADVQHEPVQVQAKSVPADLIHDGRPEVVHVELDGLLRIARLDVQVIDLERHRALLVARTGAPDSGAARGGLSRGNASTRS